MLTIRYINIEEITEENFPLFRDAVSEERKKKVDRFHFLDDAKRGVFAELLLRYSLYCEGEKKLELDIGYNQYGKPFLKKKEGFYYNISHSGSYVVIAYGNNEVGIDIEEVKSKHENIVARYFSEEEKEFVHAGVDDEVARRFTQIWTMKESYIKYLGTGLSTSLDSFSINVPKGLVTEKDGSLKEGVRLKSYVIGPEYFLSICTAETEVDLQKISVCDILQCIKESHK